MGQYRVSRASAALLDELENLYRRRYPVFLRVARGIVPDPDLARDAVQEAFASAIRHSADYRRDGPLEAWVWRTVLNMAHKQRSAALTAVDPTSSAGAVDPDGERERDDALRALVASLPNRQRHALFLRYYADLDYETIARVLGIAPGTVAATLSAAHTTLRHSLAEVRP